MNALIAAYSRELAKTTHFAEHEADAIFRQFAIKVRTLIENNEAFKFVEKR